MSKFVPSQSRMLVKLETPKEKTDGGIFIPNKSRKPSETGVVVAVGEGRRLNDNSLIPVSFKKDDLVMFSAHSGTVVEVDNIEYKIINENDVLGKIEADA